MHLLAMFIRVIYSRVSWYILLYVCRLFLRDCKLLMTSKNSGKLRGLSPSARPKSYFQTKIMDILIYTYIQQDATLHSLFYLETALHVSGGTITHHQKRKQLYLQHLVFVTPLLLLAAIVEELELVWVWCGWRTPQLFHDSDRQQ